MLVVPWWNKVRMWSCLAWANDHEGRRRKEFRVNFKIGLFCAKTLLWSLAFFSLIWGFRSKWLTFQIKQKLRSHHFLPVKQKGCEAKMLGRPMTMVCSKKSANNIADYTFCHAVGSNGFVTGLPHRLKGGDTPKIGPSKILALSSKWKGSCLFWNIT